MSNAADWLIAQKYDGSGKRKPGRPRKADEIEALVVRVAEENRRYRRIQGALSNLGHNIARSTMRRFFDTTALNRHQSGHVKRPGRSSSPSTGT
jgi:hypothetical protein